MWLLLRLHLCGSFHDLQKHKKTIYISKNGEHLINAAFLKNKTTIASTYKGEMDELSACSEGARTWALRLKICFYCHVQKNHSGIHWQWKSKLKTTKAIVKKPSTKQLNSAVKLKTAGGARPGERTLLSAQDGSFLPWAHPRQENLPTPQPWTRRTQRSNAAPSSGIGPISKIMFVCFCKIKFTLIVKGLHITALFILSWSRSAASKVLTTGWRSA